MKYLLDSACIDDILIWYDIVNGFTTNPKLLHDEDMTIEKFLFKTSSMSGHLRFIQVASIDSIKSICKDPNFNGQNTVFKVPMCPEYFNVFKYLDKNKLLSAATAVYDIVQLNQAIEFGCSYSMVYHAKNEDERFFEEASRINRGNTKLIGASFRTKNDVKKAIFANLDYATVKPEVLGSVFMNAQAEKEIKEMQK